MGAARSSHLLWGLFAAALIAVLGSFAWSQWAKLPRTSGPGMELPRYGQPPPFQLVDQDARRFDSASLKGKVWIADFIFTSCPGTCPEMTRKMAILQKELPPEIHLVSVSVDPERDTPLVLADYAKRYGADLSRWHFLTGEPQQIPRLVVGDFGLSLSSEGTAEEPITHSVRFVLMDREGTIRGRYDSTEPKAFKKLIRNARTL